MSDLNAQHTAREESATIGGVRGKKVFLIDNAGNQITFSGAATAAKQDTGNTFLAGIAGLTPAAYDYISLSYTGANLTGVVFKSGGSGGTTVATLTLAYSGSTLTSVTKT